MEPIVIDGASGEGGGQILRTSLALSLVTGRAVRLVNIRAGRKKPGLMRQHLVSVEAAVQVGRAEAAGVELGSRELRFAPRKTAPGDYRFSVVTAGSATLVLQTVLPALSMAVGPSSLILEGGTHNPFAPPFDFLARSFLPLLNRMGPRIDARLDRPGFYPAGGGRFAVRIEPSPRLQGIELLKRGEVSARSARILISRLPRHIAEREAKVIEQQPDWPAESVTIEEVRGSPGTGNVVLIEVGSAEVTEVFTSFGERGIRAEAVAGQAVDQVRRYLSADVAVGEHLADQLLLPLALAGHGAFTTLLPTAHTRTNIEVIRRFLEVDVSLHEIDQDTWRVIVRGGAAVGP